MLVNAAFFDKKAYIDVCVLNLNLTSKDKNQDF